MKNFLIFLAGALTGAGIGIFCYKKYEEYKAVTDEETTEETTEATEPVNPVEKVGGDGWIGMVIIAGVLTMLLAGAMIFRGVSRKGRY